MKESSELFKILSVDKRIEIIELLKNNSLCVSAIAQKLRITPSAASQHLRVLKNFHFVNDERQGYNILYSLNRASLEKCRQRLNRVCTCGCNKQSNQC